MGMSDPRGATGPGDRAYYIVMFDYGVIGTEALVSPEIRTVADVVDLIVGTDALVLWVAEVNVAEGASADVTEDTRNAVADVIGFAAACERFALYAREAA